MKSNPSNREMWLVSSVFVFCSGCLASLQTLVKVVIAILASCSGVLKIEEVPVICGTVPWYEGIVYTPMEYVVVQCVMIDVSLLNFL